MHTSERCQGGGLGAWTRSTSGARQADRCMRHCRPAPLGETPPGPPPPKPRTRGHSSDGPL
eukprot:7001217-Pyramimonas_sp.AAC.1